MKAKTKVKLQAPPGGIRFKVVGEPIPMARTRVLRGRHVNTRETLEYQAAIMVAARAAANIVARDALIVVPAPPPMFDKGTMVDVRILFISPDVRDRDVDNMAKNVLDGITKSKAIWKDDVQVDDLAARRRAPGDYDYEGRIATDHESCTVIEIRSIGADGRPFHGELPMSVTSKKE